MADTYGVSSAPHCPRGPIALAAGIRVDLVSPNFHVQEQSIGIHYNADGDLLDCVVYSTVFEMTGEYVARPTAPGLGIDVDEAEVRRSDRDPHDWKAPVWHHPDRSLAEW